MGTLVPRRDDFFAPFEQAFNRFFDDFFTESPLSRIKSVGALPKMDVMTVGDQFVVRADVAGIDPKDLNIEVDKDNVVTITGKLAQDEASGNETYYYKRELSSKFSRSVSLPQGIVGEPEAVVKNGILTLSWKVEKPTEELPKKIAIKLE